MRRYIHQNSDWPNFTWDAHSFAPLLASVRHRQGRLLGFMEVIGMNLQKEALLETLSEDVRKTSEIEGLRLDESHVRSSLGRRLGIKTAGLKPTDRNVDGVVELMLDATGNFDQPLSVARLHRWHHALFPAGAAGAFRVGKWRNDSKGPMQVVSGRVGRQKVHYQAPDAVQLTREVAVFLKWFNAPPDTDEVVKAALAHLWFVTLHPFDDGNGRIARAIADMALARSERSSQRYYSMSAQIRAERETYYSMLERTQRGPMDVTPWMVWFLECMGRSIDQAQHTLRAVVTKARVWQSLANVALNERQTKVVNLLLDGFEGSLTSSKWAAVAKTSQDSAHRDIQQLVQLGVLKQNAGGGRSTSYSLASLPAGTPL